MNKRQTLAITGLLCAILAGCGGGNNNNAPASPSATTAEGAWQGTLSSSGYNVQLLVLPSGQVYGFYYTSSGVLEGALMSSATTYSSNQMSGVLLDVFGGSGSMNRPYTGTFTSNNISLQLTGTSTSLTASYDASYTQTPPALSGVAGTYSGGEVTGATSVQSGVTAAVTSAGALSMTISSTCAASGTIAPDASGNFYDVALTFQGAGCALGSGTATQGVAFYASNPADLKIIVANAAMNDGMLFDGGQ